MRTKKLLLLAVIVLFVGASVAQDGIRILNDFEGEEDYNELFSTFVVPAESVPNSDVKFSYVDDAYHGNKALKIDWTMACGNPDWGGAIKCKLFNQDTTQLWDWEDYEEVKFYFKVIAPPDPYSDGDPIVDQNRFRMILFDASEMPGAEAVTGNNDFAINAADGMEFYFFYTEYFGYTILEESDWQEVTIPLVQAAANTEDGFWKPDWAAIGNEMIDFYAIAAYGWEISGVARQLHDPVDPQNSAAWTCSMLIDYAHLTGGPSAVEMNDSKSIHQFSLEQNHPNPFNPNTTITYSLKNNTPATLQIFNLLGQEIRSFTSIPSTAGVHTVTWDGLNNNGAAVNAGLYFYQLKADDFVQTRKMILAK